jgi:photosystem II stability/assembly factor-like uncharacterized protein
LFSEFAELLVKFTSPGHRVRALLAIALGVALMPSLRGQETAPARQKNLTPTPHWTAQTSGVLARLTSIFFTDPEHGWIVGSNSTILSTTDGGNTWKKSQLPHHELLRDVFFFDSQRGFLLGEYSLFNRTDNRVPTERSFLMSTSDAGAYWRLASLARPVYLKTDTLTRYTGETILRLHFVNDRTGWACGETGAILATRDGGRIWKLQRAAEVRRILYGLTAMNESQAWIVGAGGVALHTTDGGENWNEQTTGTSSALQDVHFTDAKRGWAVGSGGTILMTTNGGARWLAQNSGTSADLNDVCFVSDREGWAAGSRGTLLHTRDGGDTWEDESLKTRANLTRLFFNAPDSGWVVGANGVIFRYQPGDATPRPSISSQERD